MSSRKSHLAPPPPPPPPPSPQPFNVHPTLARPFTSSFRRPGLELDRPFSNLPAAPSSNSYPQNTLGGLPPELKAQVVLQVAEAEARWHARNVMADGSVPVGHVNGVASLARVSKEFALFCGEHLFVTFPASPRTRLGDKSLQGISLEQHRFVTHVRLGAHNSTPGVAATLALLATLPRLNAISLDPSVAQLLYGDLMYSCEVLFVAQAPPGSTVAKARQAFGRVAPDLECLCLDTGFLSEQAARVLLFFPALRKLFLVDVVALGGGEGEASDLLAAIACLPSLSELIVTETRLEARRRPWRSSSIEMLRKAPPPLTYLKQSLHVFGEGDWEFLAVFAKTLRTLELDVAFVDPTALVPPPFLSLSSKQFALPRLHTLTLSRRSDPRWSDFRPHTSLPPLTTSLPAFFASPLHDLTLLHPSLRPPPHRTSSRPPSHSFAALLADIEAHWPTLRSLSVTPLATSDAFLLSQFWFWNSPTGAPGEEGNPLSVCVGAGGAGRGGEGPPAAYLVDKMERALEFGRAEVARMRSEGEGDGEGDGEKARRWLEALGALSGEWEDWRD